MIELIDCHLHTFHSGHGEGTVEECVLAAVSAGLTTIAFTEHLPLPEDMDPKRTVSMSPACMGDYFAEIKEARERHEEITILSGVEADWLPGGEDALRAQLGGIQFVLGAVHFIDGWAFDAPEQILEWENRDVDAVWTRYLELWCDAVESSISFNVMAHPDLPKKFGYRPSFDMREYYETMAIAAAKRDVMVEVNTAGLHKPVGEVYPGSELLAAFCVAGVDCTVGSDAHSPTMVGWGIEDAYEAMRQAGYERVTVPTVDGSRRYINLTE